MHKRLTSELTSLAHDILTLKKRDDVFALKEKAYEVYEKLSVLAYIEEYINNTPQAKETKEELIEQFEKSLERKEEVQKKEEKEKEETTKEEKILPEIATKEEEVILSKEEVIEDETLEMTNEDLLAEEKKEEEITEKVSEEVIEQPFDELQQLLFDDPAFKDEATFIEETKAPHTLEDELQDTLSVDVTANLFEKASSKRSLNDRLQNTIQIDLNDRIAFVKHLFNGNQSDFNRVVSQLNTFKTEEEANFFIKKMVKPEYDWSQKEEYEMRLMEIIERRFI